MCPAPKRLAIGLATVFVCSLSATEAPAQQAGSAKRSGIRQVQAGGRELEAPPPRARSKAAGSSTPADTSTQKRAPQRQPAADDEGATQGGDARSERPRGGLDFRVEKLDPELEQLLQDWERESAKFQRLAGTFSRRRYDHVFGVEFWAVGKFVYQAPDKGNYELTGVTAPAGAKVKFADPQADDSEKWVCTGAYVLKINDKAKTYESVEIPANQRGQNIIDGPLPFLFGMKAEQAKLRYRLELLDPHPGYPTYFQLQVFPRRQDDLASWQEAKIILNPKTFLPRAVMLKHPGNSETVHIFNEKEFAINNVNKFREFFAGDPFNPKLGGYKPVLNEAAAPRTGAAPQNSKSAAPPTSDAGATDRQKAPTKRR